MRIGRTIAPTFILALAAATVAAPVANASALPLASQTAASTAANSTTTTDLSTLTALLTAKDTATQVALGRKAVAEAKLSPAVDTALTKVLDTLAGQGNRPVAKQLEGSPSEVARDALLSVLNPADYQCGTTPLNTWINNKLVPPEIVQLIENPPANPTPEQQEQIDLAKGQVTVLSLLLTIGALNATTYDTVIHADDPRFAHFGEDNGNKDTSYITRTVQDVQNFWGLDRHLHTAAMKDDIITSGDYKDTQRFGAAVLLAFIPLQPYQLDQRAYEYGNLVKTAIDFVPWLDGGENDIFTFNAFALDASDEGPLFGKFGNQVVYGDGLLNAQKDLGLAPEGVGSVIGHEFGHQIQYANGVFEHRVNTPEGTRRTELMADAYAGYYAAHKGGLTYNAKKVAEAIRMSYEVGDCGFDNPGHHGTPLQRERAALWGAGLAAGEKPTNVISTKDFQTKFDAALPAIVAPDAK